MIYYPPPSGIWRFGPNGETYLDYVTTPVFMGGSSGLPSMALPPEVQSRTVISQPVATTASPVRVTRPSPPRERSPNAAKARSMTALGDRLFRGDMIPQATKRYEQAIKADPTQAEPRARLAQVAILKGEYAEAANRLREAEAAEPGWLATADDVQSLYLEPTAFAAIIGKLETHLQARPEDRDAWLILGSLWYLSGRTQNAADIFLRLSDRKEDPMLKAFLEASKAR